MVSKRRGQYKIAVGTMRRQMGIWGVIMILGAACAPDGLNAARPPAPAGAIGAGGLSQRGASAEVALDGEGRSSIEMSIDRRSLLIVNGRRLTVLGADGRSRVRSADLSKPYSRVLDRETYYLALTSTTLDLVDKSTLIPARSIKLSCKDAFDVAVHPERRVAYVTLTDDEPAGLPRLGGARLAVVDLATFIVTRPPATYGRWLAIDPQGRRIFAGASGHADVVTAGEMQLGDAANADRSMDVLLSYTLNDTGAALQLAAANASAGATGRAVRITAAGDRVSYVSAGGSPPLSYTLPAFDAQDVGRVSAEYAMKDFGPCADLAYHDVLPIVAACGAKGVALFDRESGKRLEGRLDFTKSNPPTDPRRVVWSPDGRSLLVDAAAAGEARVLRAYDVKLTTAEVNTLLSPRRAR